MNVTTGNKKSTSPATEKRSVVRRKQRIATVGSLAGVEVVVETTTFNKFVAVDIGFRAVKRDSPTDLPVYVLDPDGPDTAPSITLHVPGIRRDLLIDRINGLAELVVGHGPLPLKEEQSNSAGGLATRIAARYAEAYAAKPCAAMHTHDDLMKALQDTTDLLAVYVHEFGGCDHSVGVCCCADIQKLEAAQAVLANARAQS